jgi:NAD+ synthase (glutamine-hydrolysing)
MTTNFGYVRVAAAVPTVKVGGVTFNGEQIESMIRKAEAEGAQIVLTPELSLTGYTCGDLVFQHVLLDAA